MSEQPYRAGAAALDNALRAIADLQAECARLAGERDSWKRTAAADAAYGAEKANELDDVRARASELRMERDAARAALARYGRHRPGCQPVMENPCPCGFQAALGEQP